MQSGHVPVVSKPHFSRFPMMNIYIHNISYNLSQWHNRGSSYFVFGHAHTICLYLSTLFVSWKYFISTKIYSMQKMYKNVHLINCQSSDRHTMCFTKKYFLNLYRGLCLPVPMECLSISLPLSLTPARIILYSYIRLWEIPWELGIIKDGIYCFIMYIRAKAICEQGVLFCGHNGL